MQLNNILSSTFKGEFKIERHYIGKEEQTEIFTSLFTLFLTWKNKIFIYLANLVVHYHHFVILQFSIIFVLVLFQMISTFCIRIVLSILSNKYAKYTQLQVLLHSSHSSRTSFDIKGRQTSCLASVSYFFCPFLYWTIERKSMLPLLDEMVGACMP